MSQKPLNIYRFLNNLNDKQYEAVTAPRSNLLILAGAGSGKTMVLVHRIAWLLKFEHCSPFSIMAVTFNKKAAEEILQRTEQMIGIQLKDIWIGTFHSIAHRLLRTHYLEANLASDFQIIDKQDQLCLLKRLIKIMNLDETKWSALQALWYINHKKDKGLRPQYIQSFNNPLEQTWRNIYDYYQETCERSRLVDFPELLLRAHELWLNHPFILNHYSRRFTNILVDEFQDTNPIQYAWIRLLANNKSSTLIVGDDDQSIYGWRGAQVDNLQYFLNDFRNVKMIRLEQNYRSTSNILKAANVLISKNSRRLGKKLWTNYSNGELITVYCALNELDEARFVVNRIKSWQQTGGKLSNCAILYRSNAQSRVIEEILLQYNIPYYIYGGVRFFERMEIKNALAYLRLIINRNDDAAFERIVNTPARGIGAMTMKLLRQLSKTRQITLWDAGVFLLKEKPLANRTALALKKFMQLIDGIEEDIEGLSLDLQIDRVIKISGLWKLYNKDQNEQIQTRIDNLKELVNAARQDKILNTTKYENDLQPLQMFLSNLVLETSHGEKVPDVEDAVQLMSMHAAKGLEFHQVFIVGMEEGIFPSSKSIEDQLMIEEERRLAYVAITRAMQKLTLTWAETRRLYGKNMYHHQPSRFIKELPKTCIDEIRACLHNRRET
ncbi:MAG: DNA helicase II [Candidatus Dasytiphilus stammeri]